MQPKSNFLIYGSYGYTGALIARLAVKKGLHPILAGRDPTRVGLQASSLGLEGRPVSLADSKKLDAALNDVSTVLHCAGPFADTARPMVDACLRTHTHYLDITGEIEVFEALAGRDAETREAEVMLIPGIGFDVVPSDCLAAHLKACLPSSNHLALAFCGLSQVSRGTSRTAIRNLNQPSVIRAGGKLVPVPPGSKNRQIDFGNGLRSATAISWGDVSTAFYSTGIPNIEVYIASSRLLHTLLGANRTLGGLMVTSPVQKLLQAAINARPAGPSEAQRARGFALLWGESADEHGKRITARMRTPEGYTLTALTSLAAVEKILAGQTTAGFKTPSLAFGADFILEIPGVSRTDIQ